MKTKVWQIALIVVGFIVCGASIAWVMGSGDTAHVNHILHYVDVETGDIYKVDITKNNIGAPGRNPVTGRMSLVRLDKKPEGSGWYVNGRDRLTIKMLDKGVLNKAVDDSSGELLDPAKQVVDYVRKY